jgi:ribonuclease P protein subunit POP4
MMTNITPKNLVRHELIGLKVKVVEAKNKTQRGIEGKVVNETLQTIKIETEIGEKTIPKKGSIFEFELKNKKVKIQGNVIIAKPEDRIRKRYKKW